MPFLCEYVDNCTAAPPGPPGATVNGIVSRAGGPDTDAKVIVGTGLSYTPAGSAGGTLSAIGTTIPSTPIGGIIMLYDASGVLPTFPLVQGGATWLLCDGAGGNTPNLVGQFVRGTNLAAEEGTTIPTGTDGYALLDSNLPSHAHDIPEIGLKSGTQVSQLGLNGVSGGPNSVLHTHSNCSGSDGFAYWVGKAIPVNASGTQFAYNGTGLTLNGNHSSNCYCYSAPDPISGAFTAVGNQTGNVATNTTALHNHTHTAGSLALANGTVIGGTVISATEVYPPAIPVPTPIITIPVGVFLYYIMRFA